MTVQATRLVRRPFIALAYKVTEENMDVLARWCEGFVNREGRRPFIRVPVSNARTSRQSEAHIGQSIILSMRTGVKTFKVYKPEWILNDFIVLRPEEFAFGGEIPPEEFIAVSPMVTAPPHICTCGAGAAIEEPPTNVRRLHVPTPNKLPPSVKHRPAR